MRERILNQLLDTINIEEAAHLARMALVNSRQFRIITLNPEMVVNATKNFEFQAAINNSHLIVPDGIGIVLASKFLNPTKFHNLRRVAGIELAEAILEAANELSKKVAIFGGKKEVLEKVVHNFKDKYPNINIVETIHGYQPKEEFGSLALKIASYKPDLVLVALGTPKQEIWINNNASLFPKSVMIGIGGSLDVWSGKKSRAPYWIRNIYLEWLFRLLTDPKRIPRVLRTLPTFAWMILKEKATFLLQTK